MPTRETRKSSVRSIILEGVFWRILCIEGILLIGTLAYAGLFENRGAMEIFWYAMRIMGLVLVIILFMIVTLNSFLTRTIIEPLEAIARANRSQKEGSNVREEALLRGDLPGEIQDILATRAKMLETILTVSEERLNLVRFIRNTFGRYVPSKVVDEILSSPDGHKIGGQIKTVTVVMSDLRGFTTLSENTDPEHMAGILNRYLRYMSEVIVEYDGIIDEFIGDAILTVFGVPEAREDDALRAVACAIAMQNRLVEFNRELSM